MANFFRPDGCASGSSPHLHHQLRASRMASKPGGCHPPGTPCLESGSRGGGRRPGELLVVGPVVAKTAVQDADQPVTQRPQGLMVGGATGSQGVVVAAGPWGAGQGGERPQVA